MKKTNSKSTLLKHSYLKEEYNHHSELFSEYIREFLKDCPEFSELLTDIREDIEAQHENENDQEEIKLKHKDLKKLYRRISKITHPDKVKSEYLENIFKQSSEDYRQNKAGNLFSTAIHLNIDTSDLDMEFILEEMDSEITTYEEGIKNFLSSVPWAWAQAKTDEEIDLIKQQVNNIMREKNGN